jgi:hypothetical protein
MLELPVLAAFLSKESKFVAVAMVASSWANW